ncbi:MAG: glycosyltransferase family 4 protein [Bacteroidota bacterium]
MRTVLLTAYAVNPYKGSEDGTGWNWVIQLAKFQRLIVITRENNLPHIKRYLTDHPLPQADNIEFVGYDLPLWQRFWKRGSFGAMPYYYLWQRGVPDFVKGKELRFDLAHNLNFHNDWTPSFLHRLGKPFVWGPIGHHPPIPTAFASRFSFSERLKDRLRSGIKHLFWRHSGALKQGLQEADLVLAMHSRVEHILPVSVPLKRMSAVGNAWVLPPENLPDHAFRILSVGRFVPLKGFDLSLRSFAAFFHSLAVDQQARVQLDLIGKGPLLTELQELAKELKVEKVVHFIEWMPRQAFLERFQQASVFLFPSHEGAGMVVPEAMSYGVPVLCLDNYGPGELIGEAGIKVSDETYAGAVTGLTQGLKRLYHDPDFRQICSQKGRARFEQHFEWAAKAAQVNAWYDQLVPPLSSSQASNLPA